MSVDLEKFSEDCATIGTMIEQLSTSNQTLRAENEKLKKEKGEIFLSGECSRLRRDRDNLEVALEGSRNCVMELREKLTAHRIPKKR